MKQKKDLKCHRYWTRFGEFDEEKIESMAKTNKFILRKN